MNYKGLIRVLDSQETASIKEARKLLVARAGMTEDEADRWVRNDLRAAFPILRDKRGAKFIRGVTRLFIDQELNDAGAQSRMTRVLKELNSEENYERYDRDLNGKSLGELYSEFEGKIEADNKASRDASSGKTFGGSMYKIGGPYLSFAAAKEAWGNSSQDWCVFHMENMYDSYTSAGQVFYVAARFDWESVPKKVGDGCPKDDYGNSLIAVSVDMDGNLATSTSRWNHAHGGSDNTYSVDELEDLLQVSFYDTFVQPEGWGVISWGEDDLVKVIREGQTSRYKIGIVSCTEEYFKGLFSVDGNVIKPKFEVPIVVRNGFGDYNYLKTDGRLLLGEWLRVGMPFSEGFASVMVDPMMHEEPYCNYIDVEGNLLSDEWFDRVFSFKRGFGVVVLDGKHNLIGTDGNLYFGIWFDKVQRFPNGDYLAKLVRNGKEYMLKPDGDIVEAEGVQDSSWRAAMGLLKKVRL